MSKILITLLVAIVIASAVVVIAGNVKVTKCSSNNGMCRNNNNQCASQIYPSNTCITRSLFSPDAPVIFSCNSPQTQNNICVNATGFGEDSTCSTPVQSLNAVCTSCTGFSQKISYDCGGLPNSMFLLSSCNSACDNCSSTIVPFRSCKRVPGVGFAFIHGEVTCGIVSVQKFAPGSKSCDAGSAVSTLNVWTGVCTEGVTVTCN
jgi:hypothetical protein